MTVPAEPVLSFDIDPEVVFRLGDELITDELQALLELVKNSYDASATETTVRIDTQAPAPRLHIPAELLDESPGDTQGDDDLTPATNGAGDNSEPTARPRPRKAQGWVEVSDNGDGMDRDGLAHGWLLISTREKRTQKEKGKTNRLGRTPLGDKGLGRLGVLRLGLRIEIRTRPRGRHEEHILRFQRNDFHDHDALSAVQPDYDSKRLRKVKGRWELSEPFKEDVSCGKIDGSQGTVIRVTGLINPDVWRDHAEVTREMLALISPFRSIDKFDLKVFIDDPAQVEALPLGELAEIRRDLATVRWSFRFDGRELTAIGRFKLNAFEPSRTNERLTRLWEQLVEPDGGATYRQRVRAGRLRGVETIDVAAPWWLEVRLSQELESVPRPTRGRRRKNDDAPPAHWASPGPFSGELDSFDLGREAELSVGNQQVFADLEPYRQWVRDVRGVKVYRDGFGIRIDEDFLKLGAAFTSASSYSALRPGNVVGYVSLTARDNAQLQETTDREGFVANQAFRAFDALLQWLVQRINFVQAQIARELGDWADAVTLPTERQPSRRAAELAEQVRERAGRTSEALAAVTTVEKTLRDLGDGALLTPSQAKGAKQATEIVTGLRELVEEWNTLRKDLDELAVASRDVEHERAELRDQLRVAYQTVGLGIVAETVAHEMTNVTGRLQATADELTPQLKGDQHRAARALLAEVKTTVRTIRVQLRHLDPQLRYQRARRALIEMRKLADEVARYHRDRLASANIEVKVTGENFQVRANRGRLQQALDNLFINSEFWLKHARLPKPRIELILDAPRLLVRDNGPGVDPALEPAIFEPFVSGRSTEEGRGLGLFITRQVLRDDNATVHLGEADGDRRKRTFVIDLSGAVPEER